MKILFEVAKKSSRILFCHVCQTTYKYRSSDFYTAVVTLSYDGSDKYLQTYVNCPVCGVKTHIDGHDKAIN